MRLLRVETEDGVFSHAVVKVEWPASFFSRQAQGRASLFLDYFHHTAAVWTQMPVVSASVRIDASPQGSVTSWHGVTVEPGDADLLRRFAAALFRIDGVEGAMVSAPTDADELQAASPGPAASPLMLDLAPRSTSAGGEIFNPVRILDRLNDLLASALVLVHGLSYQAVLRPCRAHPDLYRRVRKATALLARTPGVPQRLLESQELQERRVRDMAYLARETVSVSPGGERWLERWLCELAERPEIAAPGWTDADIHTPDEEMQAAFAHHIHPDILFGAASKEIGEPDPLASFWSGEDAGNAFRCEGLWRGGGKGGEPAPVSPLPPPLAPAGGGRDRAAGPSGAEPFFFVSYAHKDAEHIRPILDGVTRAGIPLWIDTQIAVGEEWDVRLEKMITTSSGLLVFLSPAYVASKHCRREIKFADALDKDIYASALGDFPFEGGLGYIFASLQYAKGRDQEIVRELCGRLGERLARGALH